MKQVVTAQQMRDAEQTVWDADPDIDLMSRAAGAVAKAALEFAGDVLVVVGAGNNGGDGLFAAAQLAATRRVYLWLTFGSAHKEGLAAALDAGCVTVDAAQALELVGDMGLVIDAVVGIGSRPGLPENVLWVAGEAQRCGIPVLAVDHPSGLATDSGMAHDSFTATLTITFGALKPCHVLSPASERCGEVRIIDIGVPIVTDDLRAAEISDLARWYPTPGVEDHKYTRGVVSLYTGSAQYPGAALLTCAGALNVGVGMVRYAGAAPSSMILQRHPSVVLGEGRSQAAVVGSGWSDEEVLPSVDVPVVADAGALSLLPNRSLDGWLLTPHAGELARLLGVEREAVEADPLFHVREAAHRTHSTVMLKGATQLVSEPGGRVTIAVPGPAWTGQAGSGDVLAGMCGSLIAAGLEPWKAAVLAASLQALTAEAHPGPYTPDVLAGWLPETVASLVG